MGSEMIESHRWRPSLNQKIIIAALLGLLCCLCRGLDADTLVYGNFESNALYFNNVNETADEAIFPLFGAPTVDGNALVFSNTTFAATVGENSLDFIDGRLATSISAKSGKQIYGFELSESGSFINSGDDVDVFVSGVAFATAAGTVYNADFQQWDNASGQGDWSGSLTVKFAQPVDSFIFVVDNQLFARAGAGSTASIFKDEVRLSVIVPEPSSTLLGPILAALIACRRRRDR